MHPGLRPDALDREVGPDLAQASAAGQNAFRERNPTRRPPQVRSVATSDEEEFPDGIPIYVDPAELQEADKTTQSPITLNLDGLPLAFTLKLALKQLDLAYEVRPEGLLYIRYIHSSDAHEDNPYPACSTRSVPSVKRFVSFETHSTCRNGNLRLSRRRAGPHGIF